MNKVFLELLSQIKKRLKGSIKSVNSMGYLHTVSKCTSVKEFQDNCLMTADQKRERKKNSAIKPRREYCMLSTCKETSIFSYYPSRRGHISADMSTVSCMYSGVHRDCVGVLPLHKHQRTMSNPLEISSAFFLVKAVVASVLVLSFYFPQALVL